MLINNNKINEVIELTDGRKIRSNKLLILNELNNLQNNHQILTNQVDHLSEDDKKNLSIKYEDKINALQLELQLLESVSKNPTLIKRKFTGDVKGKQILND